MERDPLDHLARHLASGLNRRSLTGLAGLGLATWLAAPSDMDARKKKKVTLCLDGQTLKVKKKKKKKLLRRGATLGACVPVPPPICTDLPSSADLQAAIDASAPGATLKLCAGTWQVATTLLVDKDLTLIGSGAGQTILDGGTAVRVMRINAGVTVTVQDLTVTRGRATSGGIGGGGINNTGNLTLRGVSVTGSGAGQGGGLYNGDSGTMRLQAGCLVSGNESPSGGGIFNVQTGTLILEAGSRVTGNNAIVAFGGGGIYNAGVLTLKSGSCLLYTSRCV